MADIKAITVLGSQSADLLMRQSGLMESAALGAKCQQFVQ